MIRSLLKWLFWDGGRTPTGDGTVNDAWIAEAGGRTWLAGANDDAQTWIAEAGGRTWKAI